VFRTSRREGITAAPAFPAKARRPEAGAAQARAKFADDALNKEFQPQMNEMNADEEAGLGLLMDIRSDKWQHSGAFPSICVHPVHLRLDDSSGLSEP
jgi:hypothetical protein